MASINGKTAYWKQMFLSICNKGAWWWFWWTKTCDTLLYKLKCCAYILRLYFNIVQHNETNQNKIDADFWQWLYKNISSIYKKFFNYHKHSQHSTLLFSSNLLPSSGFVATDTEILHMTPWHIVLACPHAPTYHMHLSWIHMRIFALPVSVTVAVHVANSCTLWNHFTNAMSEMLHIPLT